jgi:hypothetical protein
MADGRKLAVAAAFAGPGQRLGHRHVGVRHPDTNTDAGPALAHTQLW